MNKTVKWILIAVGIVVLVLLLLRFTANDNNAIKVVAAVVERCTILETVNASGKIFPENEVKVGTGISGEVTELNVREGDSVTKGQVLARIKTEVSRSPKIDVNDYRSLLQGMQAPTTSSGYVSITAPISGIVSMLSVRKGERVGGMQLSGSEVLRIADFNSMEVRVDVNENDIIKVKAGDSTDVEVEAYNKRKFKGIVSSIANNSRRESASSFLPNDATSYEVRIRLIPESYKDLIAGSSFPFRSGMNARADIKTNTRKNVLCVPASAVASRAKTSEESASDRKEKEKNSSDEDVEDNAVSDDLEEVVFVINSENKVSKRVVQTGIQDINHFEILSGLKEKEKIVAGPYSAVSRTLRSGSRVKPVSKNKLFEN